MEAESNPREGHPEAGEDEPFYKSIVGLINGVGESNGSGWRSHAPAPSVQLRIFAMVILKTEILQGHDEIIAAWTTQCGKYWLGDDYGVVESLRAKKAAAK